MALSDINSVLNDKNNEIWIHVSIFSTTLNYYAISKTRSSTWMNIMIIKIFRITQESTTGSLLQQKITKIW